MKIKLTPRLQRLADLVPKGARLADVGTDHAYLPIYLLQTNRIQQAVASDLREGPLASAKRNAEAAGLGAQLSLRLGAGLEKIAPQECDAITMAGMGGETIASILQEAAWTAQGNHELLLQPMTMLPTLRKFLLENGYTIAQELVCREGKRQYIIMRVRGGGVRSLHPISRAEAAFSQALLQDDGAKSYLEALLQKERCALQGMRLAETQDAAQTAEQEQVIEHIQKALEGLQ